MLDFNSFAPKSLVLSFLLFRQFPIFRLFVRNLTSGMHFRNSQIAQITFYLDFLMDFQGRFLKNADVRLAPFQLHLTMLNDIILLVDN